MDFLIKFLAQLFNSFKIKNPAVAAVVLFVLGVVNFGANNGSLLGVFALPEWAGEVLKYISTFLLAVTGAQTYQYLNPEPGPATASKSAK